MNMTELLAISKSDLFLKYELQEMYSDCLILQPIHSTKTANTVAIEVIYCDSNGKDNYICSIPDLSFRFSKVEAHFIGR